MDVPFQITIYFLTAVDSLSRSPLRTTSCNVHYSGSLLYDNERETWRKSNVSAAGIMKRFEQISDEDLNKK